MSWFSEVLRKLSVWWKKNNSIGDVPTHYAACFQTITAEQFTDMDAHFAYTYDVTNSADIQAVYDRRGLNTGPIEGI